MVGIYTYRREEVKEETGKEKEKEKRGLVPEHTTVNAMRFRSCITVTIQCAVGSI